MKQRLKRHPRHKRVYLVEEVVNHLPVVLLDIIWTYAKVCGSFVQILDVGWIGNRYPFTDLVEQPRGVFHLALQEELITFDAQGTCVRRIPHSHKGPSCLAVSSLTMSCSTQTLYFAGRAGLHIVSLVPVVSIISPLPPSSSVCQETGTLIKVSSDGECLWSEMSANDKRRVLCGMHWQGSCMEIFDLDSFRLKHIIFPAEGVSTGVMMGLAATDDVLVYGMETEANFCSFKLVVIRYPCSDSTDPTTSDENGEENDHEGEQERVTQERDHTMSAEPLKIREFDLGKILSLHLSPHKHKVYGSIQTWDMKQKLFILDCSDIDDLHLSYVDFGEGHPLKHCVASNVCHTRDDRLLFYIPHLNQCVLCED